MAGKYPHTKYESKYKGLVISARGANPILHPATGSVIGHMRELQAEFGVFGSDFVPLDGKGEPLYRDLLGMPYEMADIRGGQWDSGVWQADGDFTDEEHDALVAQVEYFCRVQPEIVKRSVPPVPVAPWPTYDKQTAKNVVSFAIEGGLVLEALTYERETLKRKEIVTELEAAWDEYLEREAAEKDLVAV